MKFTLAWGLALVLAGSAFAREPSRNAPIESQLREHHHYTNSVGADVHSPAHSVSEQAPTGASAKCRDGTFSFSQHRGGTCSHHGGVGAWL